MESKETPITGCFAMVTGASSGIGRAIALALSHQGARLCLVGRNPITLAETTTAARQFSEATEFPIDLTAEKSLQALVEHVQTKAGRLDILIHSAGVVRNGHMECAHIENFDLQYATNVRAPYRLTQLLLPMLTTARGQIVFVNSSVGLVAKRPDVGQYAATKHALKAVADSLREEVNPKGIRVLTMYLGRSATPMQEALHQQEGKAYYPETLLQPDDVASLVVQILSLPPTAEVTDVTLRPMHKS